MIHDTALVEFPEGIGAKVQIWHFSHLRSGVRVGSNSVLGRNVYIGPNISIGSNCKIQNNALIYDPAVIGDGVFIGPSVVFTNDKFPRAINPDGSQKMTSDWTPVGVEVNLGASIGAGAICVAPIRIGKWAVVAAGSVVTKNVPNFAMVAGCPARQVGWVGEDGHRLTETSEGFISDTLGTKYLLVGENLEAVRNS